MSLRFKLAFWGIVAAQLVVLLAMIGVKEATLQTGTTVTLQTVPVDPRSLFQGDYAILRYEIGEAGEGDSPPWDAYIPGGLDVGQEVYVTLRDDGEVWVADGYGLERAEAGPVAIRGRLTADGWLDFGIDTFFVPEGTGWAIEQAEDVKVRAAVDAEGDAVIKGVLVDGQPFEPARETDGGR